MADNDDAVGPAAARNAATAATVAISVADLLVNDVIVHNGRQRVVERVDDRGPQTAVWFVGDADASVLPNDEVMLLERDPGFRSQVVGSGELRRDQRIVVDDQVRTVRSVLQRVPDDPDDVTHRIVLDHQTMLATAEDRVTRVDRVAGPLLPSTTVGALDLGESPDRAAFYTANPGVLDMHALLGSLIHAPASLGDIRKFLHARDFDSELRAVYVALLGLADQGELVDVGLLEGAGEQQRAAHRNQRRLLTALRDNEFNPNVDTVVLNPRRLIGTLIQAAPPETLPFRGLYDPPAQMRLARSVLAHAIDRRVSAMGVLIQRTEPMIRPPRTGSRDVVKIESLRGKLEMARSQLDQIGERWAHATDRVGREDVTGDAAVALAARAGEAAPTSQPGAYTAWRARRAELYLIHVRLHSGVQLEPDLDARFFTHPDTANTWRLLQGLHDRGEPTNYASLFNEIHFGQTPLKPALAGKQILAMADAPAVKPGKIATSLRIVVNTGLRHTARNTGAAITAAAANAAVPTEGLGRYANDKLDELTALTTNASKQHAQIANIQAAPQQGRSAR